MNIVHCEDPPVTGSHLTRQILNNPLKFKFIERRKFFGFICEFVIYKTEMIFNIQINFDAEDTN